MKKNNKQTDRRTGMSRMLELTTTKRGLMLCSGMLSALSVVMQFVPFICIYYIIKEVLVTLPDLSALNAEKLMTLGGYALLGVAGNVVTYFVALMCSHKAAFETLYILKLNFAAHLAKLPLGFHNENPSGKLRKIMDENIEKIEGFIAHQFPDMIASVAAPIVMIIIMFIFDWRFGLCTLLPIILALILQARGYATEGAKQMMNKYQASLDEMNAAAVEYVRGISVLKAFNMTIFSFQNLYTSIKNFTEWCLKFTFSWKNLMSVFATLVNNIYLFIIPLGIFLGRSSGDYPALALSFLFYLIVAPSFSSVLMKIMYVSSAGLQIADGVERMDKILDKAVLPETSRPETANGNDIEFKNVSFSYNENTETLKNISFTAKSGEITAIVGPSGGGKSTIAHLVPRFWDINDGSITIGGADIRKLRQADLMQKVSFVFQDVFLFKQSILENIRVGNPLATGDDVIKAAKAAQCHEFIEKLPGGYETVIGTKGIHLSGGERQRIVIARAIIKNAPVIVLDEATAFADPENEHLIQKAFEILVRNKTVIIIAHRLSTIQNANKILVMDKGKLIESGTHDELMALRGKYFTMFSVYNKALNWRMQTTPLHPNSVEKGDVKNV